VKTCEWSAIELEALFVTSGGDGAERDKTLEGVGVIQPMKICVEP